MKRQRHEVVVDLINKYDIETQEELAAYLKDIRVLRDGFVSMNMAQNILVIKTVQGMAMAVAAALDAMKFPEIVGCIAGDDTIMAAIKSTDETKVVIDKINEILEG